MKRLQGFIGGLLNKKVDATGLAIFRIFYSVILLCEVGQIFYFKELIFDKIPFLESADIDLSYALIVWMFSLVLIVFGLFTRTATVLNYAFSIVFIATIKSYEYHMFYIYMGVNFLLMFVRVERCLSLDNLRLFLKKPEANVDKSGSAFDYYIIAFVGIGLVYLDSVFYKWDSYYWLKGLGLWLPASFTNLTIFDTSWLLNAKWLVLGLGYLTLMFETVFIFLLHKPKLRVPLLIIGMGLHLGIIIEFPIPWFGLGVSALYLLLVPQKWWRILGGFLGLSKQKLTVHSIPQKPIENLVGVVSFCGNVRVLPDVTLGKGDLVITDLSGIEYKGRSALYKLIRCNPLCYLTFLIFKFVAPSLTEQWVSSILTDSISYGIHSSRGLDLKRYLDALNVRLISSIFLLVVLLQINVTLKSDLINRASENIGLGSNIFGSSVAGFSNRVANISKKFLGITRHTVFLDAHFEGYNHTTAVEAVLPNGEKEWLPFISENGHVGNYNYSFIWAKWTFRVMAPSVNMNNYEKGIRDVTTFWAGKNGYRYSEITYNLYYKGLNVPVKWEKDFLRSQYEVPWTKFGEAKWEDNQFVLEAKDIESLTY
ncbi:HTTM domain-containing protein [Roseivirga pacifica]|uniref:HTTM domain-containing protein n=1 Tax=Roseivirga pacifica TaxID=1267423 RepID=UPI0020949774|nr:HTTM domain-containing protein [Roseivirga pacifica]MCO6357458.1 hypothetical protein [Roseivirga pacifica]MCO6367778.1 hypothetical protein [Roseivirga pacifica]MCO6369691.1 hypothetical protein [Roseivirga pacifica]MCO6373545.1 hypothetical protein [Roseivirga pacifica]MCO6377150.1 hypothetical protein [Roseivirga pacifica]